MQSRISSLCRNPRIRAIGSAGYWCGRSPFALAWGVALAVLLASTSVFAASDSPPKSATKPKSKPPPKELKRADIDASMVGYIDDSSVHSQVRLRFDAGFNDPRPDRAEYFYAGACCPAPSSQAVQRTLNFQQLYISGEYAPIKRFSIFTTIPYRWIQPIYIPAPNSVQPIPSGGGISDVQVGLKFGLIANDSRQLTFQLTSYFPSGDGAKGLGTNHYSIEPMLLYYQHLSDRVAIESEFGDTHPIGGSNYYPGTTPPTSQTFAGDVLMYGVGPSYRLVDRDKYQVTPVLELVAWHVFGGLQTGSDNVVQSAAGINVFNIKIGARLDFGKGNSIYAGYGHGVTSDIWYSNLFRIEYRHAF
jgi:hypothetical protein